MTQSYGWNLQRLQHSRNQAAGIAVRSIAMRVSVCLSASGVGTGWTGVHMSTPLLLEVAPEIDTNPTSFYRGRDRGVGSVAPPPDPRSALAMSAHPTF